MNDDLKQKLSDELEAELENGSMEVPAKDNPETVPKETASEGMADQDSNEDEEDVVFDEEAELGPAEAMKRLRAKLKTAVEEKQTYLNGWQRDKAEFINARKRDEESKMDFLKFAKQNVIEDILPVLDSFDGAIGNTANWESVSKEWRAGVEGIYSQLVGILTKHDVKAFGAVGDVFDPNLHQSISMVTSEDKGKDGTVAEILQKGYMLSGKVIRPAMVRVFEA